MDTIARIIFSTLLLSLISGCAYSRLGELIVWSFEGIYKGIQKPTEDRQHARTIQLVPTAKKEMSNARIFVLREARKIFGDNISAILFENERKIGASAPGGLLAWETNPGEKLIRIKRGKQKRCLRTFSDVYFDCREGTDGLLLVDNKYEKAITLELLLQAKEKETYFILLELNIFLENEFKLIPFSEAQKVSLTNEHRKLFNELVD